MTWHAPLPRDMKRLLEDAARSDSMPDWPAPRARARAGHDARRSATWRDEGVRRKLRALLPAEPAWLRQVHGTAVVDLDEQAAGARRCARSRASPEPSAR